MDVLHSSSLQPHVCTRHEINQKRFPIAASHRLLTLLSTISPHIQACMHSECVRAYQTNINVGATTKVGTMHKRMLNVGERKSKWAIRIAAESAPSITTPRVMYLTQRSKY